MKREGLKQRGKEEKRIERKTGRKRERCNSLTILNKGESTLSD